MTRDEMDRAALLYPGSEAMQEKYIRARRIADAIPRRVVVGKDVPVQQFFARTIKEAFGS